MRITSADYAHLISYTHIQGGAETMLRNGRNKWLTGFDKIRKLCGTYLSMCTKIFIRSLCAVTQISYILNVKNSIPFIIKFFYRKRCWTGFPFPWIRLKLLFPFDRRLTGCCLVTREATLEHVYYIPFLVMLDLRLEIQHPIKIRGWRQQKPESSLLAIQWCETFLHWPL
jgi:hypothetical protein